MLAEFAEGRLVGREALRVPRFVAIRRVPGNGRFAAPDEALEALRRMELDPGLPREAWPFLEVAVALDEPRPSLREEVEALLAGRPVRLVKLAVRLTGSGGALADATAPVELAALAPEDVFRRLYQRNHEGEPDPALAAAFRELLTSVEESL
ncbi:exonuclease SbcCD subunit D C-terminal domain-containing protein [Azospirillum thermophilum]|uniref:exonuclease SbcCD subunit D C-terminal domain-containing protein n=1 Tax=Azospirillum thermophilum TaxID=2202148 RepID=UPI002683DA9A